MRSVLAVAALTLFASVACSAVVDETESSESANTEGRPLTVIKGREWGRCWFDVVGSDAKLSCRSTPRGNDPFSAKVKVTAASMVSATATPIQKQLDVEAGGTVVVGSLPRSAFPVLVMIEAELSREASTMIGNERGETFWLKPKVDRPEDLSASAPAIFAQPFDLWPVAFIDTRDEPLRGAFSVSAEYDRSIAPFSTFLGDAEITMKPYVSGRDVVGKVHYLAAPASGAIEAKLTFAGAPIAATIGQPGYYAVTPEGLRPATPAEIARDFPSGAPPVNEADGGDPFGPSGADAGTDATPPSDPDPTCGGDGQSRCTSTGCDDGTRYNSTTGRCIACGDHGETYCFDGPNNLSGAMRCNDGTRYNSMTGKCIACGDDGEPYCFTDANNASGSQRCNDGTRYNTSTGKCIACGDDGETYCFTDANNASGSMRCNDGTRYNSSTGKCVACGAEGQTYCFDDPNNASGSPKCNAGLRYSSSSGKCVP